MSEIKVLARISLLIFLYYVSYALYVGILHPTPAPGDSFDYHIPIAQSLLNGTFLTLPHPKLPQWYYPGASEAFTALFILFHIPLTLSNLFAVIILFFCLFKLARTFSLSYYSAILFSCTICTLNVLVRWFNAVSIDVWVAVFYCLVLILLEKLTPTIKHFFFLGICVGMLIGSKYTTWYFLIPLVILYIKPVFQQVTIKKVFAFLIPFSIFGLFWYIRNYFLTHNPFYPLPIFGFSGPLKFTEPIWHTALLFPRQMADAGFGEYKLWLFMPLLAVFWLTYKYLMQKNYAVTQVDKLVIIGIINVFFFLFFPTSHQPWIMVSSFRYSYPVWIPLMLGLFLLIKKTKWETWLGYLTVGNMLLVTSFAYYPKLILFFLPIGLGIFYYQSKENKK